MKSLVSSVAVVSSLGLALGACLSPPVETPAVKVVQEEPVRVDQNVKNKVDILFAIDNSPSMTPKQNELKARFPELIKILDNFAKGGNPAHYHIGVVSSDLGAGSFTLGNGQCKPNGDNGKLVAKGAAAAADCGTLGSGLNFIDYNQIDGSNNLNGMTLEKAFGCIAAVGDKGCGFEQQLEAVYRALHDNVPGNEGFFREDALLAVVWVTDEDDCSAPATTDLFDPQKTGQYGALLSYRCNRFGYICAGSQPPYGSSGGALMSCVPSTEAEGGKLFDIQRYVNFFTQPRANGGAKLDPNDVILASIAAPPTPIESLLANPNPVPPGPYTACPGPADGKTCDVVIQHSCIAPSDNAFFGDPALRISTVVNSTKNHKETSICDTDYSGSLQELGKLIVSQIGPGCLQSPIADPTEPDCVVEDVTAVASGGQSIKLLPWCNKAGAGKPCWELTNKLPQYNSEGCGQDPKPDTCKLPDSCKPVMSPVTNELELNGVTVQRDGDPPPATFTRVACSTVAVSGK